MKRKKIDQKIAFERTHKSGKEMCYVVLWLESHRTGQTRGIEVSQSFTIKVCQLQLEEKRSREEVKKKCECCGQNLTEHPRQEEPKLKKVNRSKRIDNSTIRTNHRLYCLFPQQQHVFRTNKQIPRQFIPCGWASHSNRKFTRVCTGNFDCSGVLVVLQA